MSRLLELYNHQIRENLKTKLGLENIFEVPKLKKIILNMGVGDAKEDSKLIDKAIEDLTLISGQKAIKTQSKKAISGFKIRAGMPLGAKVTLRNKVMYEFLDRLVNIAIPRIRDFRGLNTRSFDGSGNFSMGIKEHVIFPNSLPEILTGIRVAVGMCWGTLVAAEFLAGTTGIGFVENVAKKYFQYEVIWITIFIMGMLGLLFDITLRKIINKTIPWRGKG